MSSFMGHGLAVGVGKEQPRTWNGKVIRFLHRTCPDPGKNHGITPKMQRQMVSALPCKEVISMDTGHSPFWSKPEELATHLLAVGGLVRSPA